MARSLMLITGSSVTSLLLMASRELLVELLRKLCILVLDVRLIVVLRPHCHTY